MYFIIIHFKKKAQNIHIFFSRVFVSRNEMLTPSLVFFFSYAFLRFRFSNRTYNVVTTVDVFRFKQWQYAKYYNFDAVVVD